MSWRRSPGRGTGEWPGMPAGASPGPGSAGEVRMTFLPARGRRAGLLLPRGPATVVCLLGQETWPVARGGRRPRLRSLRRKQRRGRGDRLHRGSRLRPLPQSWVAYFDAGMTDRAEGLFRSWLEADPGWGWGWIGWADCYLPWGSKPADLGRAEKRLRRGYRVPGVRDRADIAERLQEVCEDTGRPDEARQFREQARRLRHGPADSPAGAASSPGVTARAVKWDAVFRVLAGAGRSSRSAAAPR
jgi:hypothetical protein